MVSTKLALAIGAAATLFHVASARDCKAKMVHGSKSAIQDYDGIEVRFADNDELLDSQDSDDTEGLDIFDGWQTLTSDKLGGDVRLSADGEVGLITYAFSLSPEIFRFPKFQTSL